MRVDAEAIVNPNGNAFNYQDFLHDDSRLRVSLDVEMPLSFIANDLTLADTMDFSLGDAESSTEAVKGGTFKLLVDNGFPLDAEVELVFLNQNGNEILTLFDTPAFINPGVLDNDCIISNVERTQIEVAVGEPKMRLIQSAEAIYIRVKFNTTSTPSCTDHIKIYSDYTFGYQLIGDFRYEVKL